MERFPVGIIVLIIVSLLIFFGLAHRALDRLRLSDRAALAVIVALVIGHFINIPLASYPYPASVNVGGAVIPVLLAGYLLLRAGTGKEVVRALTATLVTAAVVFLVGSLLMRGIEEPGGRFELLDTLWVYPLVGGLTAYLVGRSRRAAFIAGTLGILLLDIGYYIWLWRTGAPAGRVDIGGGGAFDAIVMAGLFAVLLAELLGEGLERLAGGPKVEKRPPELVQALQKPDFANQAGTEEGGGEGGKDRQEENNRR